MLRIVHSTLALKEKELRLAKNIVKDIIGDLNAVTPNSNLTKQIGPYIESIRKLNLKVLDNDAADAIQTLRRVCSGELDIPEAICIFATAYDELELLEKLYENFTGKITLPDE